MKICSQFISSAFALLAFASSADADQIERCKPIAALESFTSAGTAPGGATCATFLGQAAKTGISCYWEFHYRDDSAQKLANSLWDVARDCRPGTHLATDKPVNHPDSFQLREWATQSVIYRVSVKDKAGQQRTFVFLGFEKY